MGFCDVPAAVFIETNIGTRLAVPASPEITADDFKREVERAHLNCFPEIGNIRVEALMVKQKLYLYHLSGSLPLKYAFLGSNPPWFLWTSLGLSKVPTHSKYNEVKVQNLDSAGGVITDSFAKRRKCRRKKAKVQRFSCLKGVMKILAASCFLRKRKRKNVKNKRLKTGQPRRGPIQRSLIDKEATVISEATGEAYSEPSSVSGIMKKYFTDYDEGISRPLFPLATPQYKHRKQLQHCSTGHEYPKLSPVAVHSPPQVPEKVWVEKPSSEASMEKKHQKPEVGKHIMLASNRLRLTPTNRQSILSLCRHNDEESPLRKFTGTICNLAFEVPDDSDQL